MSTTEGPMIWEKLKVGNQIVYERRVQFGNVRLWLVAESSRWHVETGSGEVLTEGKASSYTDASRKATEALIRLLEDTRQSVHVLEVVHEKTPREKSS